MQEQIYRLKSLLQALTLYVGARGKLLQIEAKEAGIHLSVVLALTLIIVTCLIAAWFLAMPALIWLLARSQGWSWTNVALVAAGLHLVGATGFFFVLKKRLSHLKIFEESINQFQRDREWISDHPNSD